MIINNTQIAAVVLLLTTHPQSWPELHNNMISESDRMVNDLFKYLDIDKGEWLEDIKHGDSSPSQNGSLLQNYLDLSLPAEPLFQALVSL